MCLNFLWQWIGDRVCGVVALHQMNFDMLSLASYIACFFLFNEGSYVCEATGGQYHWKICQQLGMSKRRSERHAF